MCFEYLGNRISLRSEETNINIYNISKNVKLWEHGFTCEGRSFASPIGLRKT